MVIRNLTFSFKGINITIIIMFKNKPPRLSYVKKLQVFGGGASRKVQNLWENIKNPRSEAGVLMKRIGMGVGICMIGMAASMLGLR